MALSPLNRALNQIPKRAEKQEGPQLHESFVDSGIADVLDTVDHQVLYGRRGTGKTHALSYLAAEAAGRGDIALNIDLRAIGSPDGVLDPESATAADRAGRLLVDLLTQFHDALLNAVLADESLIDDDAFTAKADELLSAISSVRVTGEVETTHEIEDTSTKKSGWFARVTQAGFSGGMSGEKDDGGRDLVRETRKGAERLSLNFGDVARALGQLAAALGVRRVWLLLDEWSSVPRELQPYLAEFLVRCILPLQKFTIKIAAIEQQTNFRAVVNGMPVGIELGADMGAHINLDDFLVHEGNEERSRDFFRRLFYKQVLSVAAVTGQKELTLLRNQGDVVRLGFTDSRAFDELVRAAEGVPRDALYIAAKAASRAGQERLSVPGIRAAAQSWYHTDKSAPLNSREEAQRLLAWIVDRVIREKRARAFLVNQGKARDPLLQALFDARVLHIVRRGYSAQDEPGERYDVWSIDYGAYVDLFQTRFSPVGALPIGTEGQEDYVGIDVPRQDLRAIRRAILDLDEFYGQDRTTESA
jgi:hypothetical protein